MRRPRSAPATPTPDGCRWRACTSPWRSSGPSPRRSARGSRSGSGRWRPPPRPSPPSITGIGGFPSMAGARVRVAGPRRSRRPMREARSRGAGGPVPDVPRGVPALHPAHHRGAVAAFARSAAIRAMRPQRASASTWTGSRCSEAISAGPSRGTRSSRPFPCPPPALTSGARKSRPGACDRTSVRVAFEADTALPGGRHRTANDRGVSYVRPSR